ncbi:MAG: quinone-dependent dihydroorotate dehydrogenase [Leptospiraceae bacterium]|nr:quinone-dependent dihydroorotate dehydrogenase [Leptospiraceae bacterium]
MLFLYDLLRPLLFQFDAEFAHKLVLKVIKKVPLLIPKHEPPQLCEREFLGVKIQSPLILAAGFDKEGLYFPYLARLGFGGIEVGTFTPKAQVGNPRPRLFRLPHQKALLNRMGFNNPGIEVGLKNILRNIHQVPKHFILGVSLGKSRDTPIEKAFGDYAMMLQYLDKNLPAKNIYITLNISSPNTALLQELQKRELFESLLKNLPTTRFPLLVKLSFELKKEDLRQILQLCQRSKKIAGIILTNTASDPTFIRNLTGQELQGGISGEPLREGSRNLLKLAHSLESKLTLVSSGGVMDPQEAYERLQLGAQAVQIYTGLIYYGPYFVRDFHQLLIEQA